MRGNGAFVAFAIVGLSALLFLWRATEPAPEVSIAAPEPDGTSVVYVNVTLLDPTATVTTIPTVRPTNGPTVPPGLNWCSTATPGATCEVPPYPTGTATVYPDCADMASISPGSLCQWR